MKTALVTTTFSKSVNNLRFQLALKTCQAAKTAGYPIYIVDGSPEPQMSQLLRDAGAIVEIQKEEGMGASRRQCLAMGLESGADVIVWLEPEKHTLVPLLEPCISLVINNEADAVIPRRPNLDGYPQYQHFSELRANWEIADVTGRYDIDYLVGPRIMNQLAAGHMLQYDGRIGSEKVFNDNWEILFVPILWWLIKGLTVKSVTVDYQHPPEQLVEDDEVMRQKRDKQRKDLVDAMRIEANHLRYRPRW